MNALMEKQKKQDLGIFYTDPLIVNFIYDILLLWKNEEDRKSKRWQSRKPSHYPSVIDPACGEGIFLKAALEKDFTKPKYVFGVDIDEHAVDRWEEINLLKSFGSRAELMNHFYHQNGLLPIEADKTFRYKKGGLIQFDTVVGNPPYGGVGVNLNKKIDKSYLKALENFEILRYRKNFKKNANRSVSKPSPQTSLFDVGLDNEYPPLTTLEVNQYAESTPIEVLFIERFIQLAKPGGSIVMVIPDGILSNVNLDYVRQFICDKTKVEAIVSLPREAFKNTGTNAKTSILFLRKNIQVSQDISYPLFLAEIGKLDEASFTRVFSVYKEYINGK